MSFPRYERYKDSGVEWLGEVPEHWDIIPLRYLIGSIESGTSVNAADVPAAPEELGVLKTSCVYSGNFEPAENKTVMDSEIDRVSCPLKLGTLIVSRMNTPDLVGATGLVKLAPSNLYLPDRLWQVSISHGQADYVYFWAQSGIYRSMIRSICAGSSSSMQGLGQDQYKSLILATPPNQEQIAIAVFLHGETAKIDALIHEQRRLMELLKEKRQAVISHAVTKGLNPHVPMMDSGIEWLGEVPAHWEILKFSWVFKASKGRNGQMLTKEYCGQHEGEYPVFSGQTVDGGVMGRIDEFEFDFPNPGVLFSTTVGAKAMDLKQISGRFSLSQNCMIIWPIAQGQERVLRFFYYHCQPLFLYERDMIPDHMQASFRMEDLYGYRIAIPPLTEQHLVASYLDDQTLMFDSLIIEAEKQVSLLQERRAALISAAVTGKIDVRNYTPKEAA